MANPPVYEYSYKWFIDSTQVLGQSGYYFEIFNVTRSYHDKQVRCSVENNLGVAMGLKSLEVKCTYILHSILDYQFHEFSFIFQILHIYFSVQKITTSFSERSTPPHYIYYKGNGNFFMVIFIRL